MNDLGPLALSASGPRLLRVGASHRAITPAARGPHHRRNHQILSPLSGVIPATWSKYVVPPPPVNRYVVWMGRRKRCHRSRTAARGFALMEASLAVLIVAYGFL